MENPEAYVSEEDYRDLITLLQGEGGQELLDTLVIDQSVTPPTPEVVEGIRLILSNYENIVRASLTYLDEDVCSLDREYEALVMAKFRIEANVKALNDREKELSKKIVEAEKRATEAEIKLGESIEHARLGFGYDRIKHHMLKDRKELKIDDIQTKIASGNMAIPYGARLLLSRIDSQLSEDVAVSASTDAFDRSDTPTVLYLRRLRHDRDRKAQAESASLEIKLSKERAEAEALKLLRDDVVLQIADGRDRLISTMNAIRLRRDVILSDEAMSEEKERRASAFGGILKDIAHAMDEYRVESEKQAAPSSLIAPEEDVEAEEKEEKHRRMKPREGKYPVRDEDIATSAAIHYGGTMTSEELIRYADDHYPGWQEGRNEKNPDQAKRSIRVAWRKISNEVPGDKSRRTLKKSKK